MSLDRISIPAESGAALLLPGPAEYGKLVEKNRKLAENALIDGCPLAELAKEARQFAIDSAIDYTGQLGFNAAPPQDPDEPIIATGHQPVMAHPGIALKIFALIRGARNGACTPLFISQDCDEFRADTVPAPFIDKGLKKRDFTLFPQTRKNVYETSEVELVPELLKRLQNLRDTLGDPRLKEVGGAMDQFLARLNLLSLDFKSFTSRSIVMRRAWEEPLLGDYLETTVSILCKSRPFRIFGSYIIRNLNKFANIYNNELQQYRVLHKLRYSANPFPDLGHEGEWAETPFWVMSGAVREKLYAKPGGGDTFIKSDHLKEISISEIVDGGIDIRPRAILLSIYQRLFVCDLFIHGVGGAKYDTITDNIIVKFFRRTPPSYASVSATLFPDIEVEDRGVELAAAHQSLRDIVGRPEYVAQNYPSIIEVIEPLKVRKESLISEIRAPNSDKKSLGGEIAKLNAEMSQLLAPVKQGIVAQIDKLEKAQKECEAAHSREYPFFFYRPEEVMDLLNQ